jgi:hypothetical protein
MMHPVTLYQLDKEFRQVKIFFIFLTNFIHSSLLYFKAPTGYTINRLIIINILQLLPSHLEMQKKVKN